MDCQACKGDKFNVIGESCRGTSLKSPVNGKLHHDKYPAWLHATETLFFALKVVGPPLPLVNKYFLIVMIMFTADMSSPSRLDRTPSHSPSRSPDPKRILWTPPAKVITNPRLNQISSPVGMVTINPQSPLNKTPPKKQSIHMQTLSPKISASPTNLKKGIVYT